MKKSILALTVATILLSGCNDDEKTVEVFKVVEVIKEVPPVEVTQVKNVILMIGDGMGAQQVGLLEEYARRAPQSIYNSKNNTTALSKFANAGQMGLSLNWISNRFSAITLNPKFSMLGKISDKITGSFG